MGLQLQTETEVKRRKSVKRTFVVHIVPIEERIEILFCFTLLLLVACVERKGPLLDV